MAVAVGVTLTVLVLLLVIGGVTILVLNRHGQLIIDVAIIIIMILC